jgi:hypothetical protein
MPDTVREPDTVGADVLVTLVELLVLVLLHVVPVTVVLLVALVLLRLVLLTDVLVTDVTVVPLVSDAECVLLAVVVRMPMQMYW